MLPLVTGAGGRQRKHASSGSGAKVAPPSAVIHLEALQRRSSQAEVGKARMDLIGHWNQRKIKGPSDQRRIYAEIGLASGTGGELVTSAQAWTFQLWAAVKVFFFPPLS